MRNKVDPIRLVISLVVLALLLQPFAAAQEPQSSQPTESQPNSSVPPPSHASSAAPATTELDGSQLPDSPSSSQAQAANENQEPSGMQTAVQPQQPPQNMHEPVGTAAAETIPTMGVAASRPAGAALAPAKQRQVRSFLIKMGAIVGAGVAIGAVVALSSGSPSKPPGVR